MRGAMTDLVGKLLRYLITGGAAALVDVAGFGLLRFLKFPLIVAAACSFLVATIVNFLLSAKWVFDVTASRQRYAAFLAGTLGGLTVNVSFTVIGMSHLKLTWAISKMFGVAAAFILNFWINARIVFRSDTDRTLASS